MAVHSHLEPFPPFVDMTEAYSHLYSPPPKRSHFSIQELRQKLAHWYYKCEVTLCLYVMEPWEKFVLSTFITLCAGLLLGALILSTWRMLAPHAAQSFSNNLQPNVLVPGLMETKQFVGVEFPAQTNATAGLEL